MFLVEASQAGVFGIRGVGADQLQPVLAIHCPTVLFPYARETVVDLSGFGVRAFALRCDVTEEASVRTMMKDVGHKQPVFWA